MLHGDRLDGLCLIESNAPSTMAVVTINAAFDVESNFDVDCVLSIVGRVCHLLGIY